MDFQVEQLLKPGFRIIITFAEHVCDHVPKKILQLATYGLQVFFCEGLFFSMIITAQRSRRFKHSKSIQNYLKLSQVEKV